MPVSNPLTSTRRTRQSNADKHPGLPDAPAKRRTHSEKLAHDTERMEMQVMQHNEALSALATISSVEAEMGAAQLAKRALAPAKKGIRPAEKASAKDSVAAADLDLTKGPGLPVRK